MTGPGPRIGLITGTRIAAICGIHPYLTPLGAWREIVGLAPPKPDTPAMARGRKREPIIAAQYAAETGHTLVPGGPTRIHPQHAWAAGTPDYLDRGRDDEITDTVIEIKTTSRWGDYGEPGTDAVPPHVRCQVAWYLAVCDLPRALVLVEIARAPYVAFPIARDLEFERNLLDIAADFHARYVATGIEPGSEGI